MKKTFLLVPLAIILVMSLFLVSCEDEPEIKTYKVTFLKDKGDTTPYDEKTVLEGTGITEAPKEPTKGGCYFVYWKLLDGESKYDLSTPVKKDITLVAEWEPIEYMVSFMDGEVELKEYSQTIKHGEKAEEPKAPEKEGYTFLYWSLKDSEEKYDFTNVITDNTILVANWILNKYKVEFYDEEGETLYSSVDVEHGQSLSEVAPTDVGKTGYTLVGWTTTKGSQEAYGSATQIKGKLTLYPIWNINKYKVTFKNFDGTDYETKDVDYGETVTKPSGPSRTGYTFKHWATSAESKTEYDFASPISDNLVLYPVFEINEYTVKFIGDEHIPSVPEPQIVAYGNKAEDPNASATEGYIITGWTTVKGGDTPFDFTSSPIESDITLYPIVKEELTLNFYDGDVFKYSSKVASGSTFVYPDNPTKDGYDFAGWKKKGEEVYIYSSTVIDSDMELESCWNKAGLLSVTNTDNVKGNTTYKTDPEVEVIIIPEKINGVTPTKIADYAFNQWANITKVVLPPTINSIGDKAFYECTNLSQCALSDNITAIGSAAFYGCSNLSVNIPNRITSIGFEAFRKSKILEAILPETLTTMGNNVFYECKSLTIAVIPSTITTIPMNTFNGCDKLKNVTINGNITKIGAYAFKHTGSYNKSITLSLPASIVEESSLIDVDAFFGRYTTLNINQKQSLSKLTIPDKKWGAYSLTINWLPEDGETE